MVVLGHVVIAREMDVEPVAAVTAGARPDVALAESSEHACELIERIVREAATDEPHAYERLRERYGSTTANSSTSRAP